ncbi:hypothetical protein DMENIID0001_153390 [Sergentomyia squamirostris]
MPRASGTEGPRTITPRKITSKQMPSSSAPNTPCPGRTEAPRSPQRCRAVIPAIEPHRPAPECAPLTNKANNNL